MIYFIFKLKKINNISPKIKMKKIKLKFLNLLINIKKNLL